MKSVFSLFTDYTECREAVDELLDKGFDEEEMNVVVDATLAKSYMNVNLERVNVRATGALGEATQGLDMLLSTEQPVRVSRLGDVYAAGDLATIWAKTAAAEGAGTVTEALEEFGVPGPVTESYVEGVINGGVLFWIRTSDRRASKAAEICQVHNAVQIFSYGGD